MSARWDVLGFGAVAVDDLLYVDHYPAPDTKLPVREEQRQGGGLAGTALVAAARLGARTAYFGVLGDDELSRFTLSALRREGVDCSPVLRRPEARPFHSRIIVDRGTGQRSILFSDRGVTAPRPEEVPADLVSGCRVLFLDHTVVGCALHLLGLARARGVPVVADIERDTGGDWGELVRRVDHLIVGAGMAARLAGTEDPEAAARALAGPERACAAVTAGERGCWYAERGSAVRHVPAFRVPVVDTTGCGDVFHGAYAACLAAGESVASAVRVASAAAAMKARQPGGRSGIPNRPAVERFLEERDG